AACCAICFALRPTWCPICNRGSCVCTSIRCRTRGPTAQSLICWNISTRPSSPIPAPICDSSTRSPVSPKRPTWPHIKIPQIRRSEPVFDQGAGVHHDRGRYDHGETKPLGHDRLQIGRVAEEGEDRRDGPGEPLLPLDAIGWRGVHRKFLRQDTDVWPRPPTEARRSSPV